MARLTLALQPKVKKGTLHVFKMMAGTLLTVMVPNTAMFPGNTFGRLLSVKQKVKLARQLLNN
ncbi:hypothetical protein WP50_18670 [Lactiplantibacillus plantarum]|nr:hypothetical protein WP50_18670 [Lactiplantibacillus plantarum]